MPSSSSCSLLILCRTFPFPTTKGVFPVQLISFWGHELLFFSRSLRGCPRPEALSIYLCEWPHWWKWLVRRWKKSSPFETRLITFLTETEISALEVPRLQINVPHCSKRFSSKVPPNCGIWSRNTKFTRITRCTCDKDNIRKSELSSLLPELSITE